MHYSAEIIDAFNGGKYIYSGQSAHLLGYAGDIKIGEYVQLYIDITKVDNFIDSTIIKARYSVIGGILSIAAAEKFCSLIEGKTFDEALIYCDDENGLKKLLSVPEDKIHCLHFLYQAFYKVLETLSNHK